MEKKQAEAGKNESSHRMNSEEVSPGSGPEVVCKVEPLTQTPPPSLMKAAAAVRRRRKMGEEYGPNTV